MACFCRCKAEQRQTAGTANVVAVKASIPPKQLSIVIIRSSNRPSEQGTGVLIHSSLVLTSHMSLPNIDSAQACEISLASWIGPISNTVPAAEASVTILTVKLLPSRYFVTNPELGVTVVACEPVSPEVSPLGLGIQKVGRDVLHPGQCIYLLGPIAFGEHQGIINFGEGMIASQDTKFIKFSSLNENVWEPGSAGFDKHGNFAFMVGDNPPISQNVAARAAPSIQSRKFTPATYDSSKQPGVLVQAVRRWLRSNWGGNFDHVISHSKIDSSLMLCPTTEQVQGPRKEVEDDMGALQKLQKSKYLNLIQMKLKENRESYSVTSDLKKQMETSSASLEVKDFTPDAHDLKGSEPTSFPLEVNGALRIDGRREFHLRLEENQECLVDPVAIAIAEPVDAPVNLGSQSGTRLDQLQTQLQDEQESRTETVKSYLNHVVEASRGALGFIGLTQEVEDAQAIEPNIAVRGTTASINHTEPVETSETSRAASDLQDGTSSQVDAKATETSVLLCEEVNETPVPRQAVSSSIKAEFEVGFTESKVEQVLGSLTEFKSADTELSRLEEEIEQGRLGFESGANSIGEGREPDFPFPLEIRSASEQATLPTTEDIMVSTIGPDLAQGITADYFEPENCGGRFLAKETFTPIPNSTKKRPVQLSESKTFTDKEERKVGKPRWQSPIKLWNAASTPKLGSTLKGKKYLNEQFGDSLSSPRSSKGLLTDSITPDSCAQSIIYSLSNLDVNPKEYSNETDALSSPQKSKSISVTNIGPNFNANSHKFSKQRIAQNSPRKSKLIPANITCPMFDVKSKMISNPGNPECGVSRTKQIPPTNIAPSGDPLSNTDTENLDHGIEIRHSPTSAHPTLTPFMARQMSSEAGLELDVGHCTPNSCSLSPPRTPPSSTSRQQTLESGIVPSQTISHPSQIVGSIISEPSAPICAQYVSWSVSSSEPSSPPGMEKQSTQLEPSWRAPCGMEKQDGFRCAPEMISPSKPNSFCGMQQDNFPFGQQELLPFNGLQTQETMEYRQQQLPPSVSQPSFPMGVPKQETYLYRQHEPHFATESKGGALLNSNEADDDIVVETAKLQPQDSNQKSKSMKNKAGGSFGDKPRPRWSIQRMDQPLAGVDTLSGLERVRPRWSLQRLEPTTSEVATPKRVMDPKLLELEGTDRRKCSAITLKPRLDMGRRGKRRKFKEPPVSSFRRPSLEMGRNMDRAKQDRFTDEATLQYSYPPSPENPQYLLPTLTSDFDLTSEMPSPRLSPVVLPSNHDHQCSHCGFHMA